MLIVVAEGGVDVAIAGGDAGLHSTLDHVAGQVGGLQRVKKCQNFEFWRILIGRVLRLQRV